MEIFLEALRNQDLGWILGTSLLSLDYRDRHGGYAFLSQTATVFLQTNQMGDLVSLLKLVKDLKVPCSEPYCDVIGGIFVAVNYVCGEAGEVSESATGERLELLDLIGSLADTCRLEGFAIKDSYP